MTGIDIELLFIGGYLMIGLVTYLICIVDQYLSRYRKLTNVLKQQGRLSDVPIQIDHSNPFLCGSLWPAALLLLIVLSMIAVGKIIQYSIETKIVKYLIDKNKPLIVTHPDEYVRALVNAKTIDEVDSVITQSKYRNIK
jgi:hypothetical protein